MSLRCIVAGYGWAGRRHAEAIASCAEAELAAVVDRDPACRETALKDYGVPTYADTGDALRNETFDAAVVATLPPAHAEICAELLEAGKHIYCEKPLSRKAEEVKRLIRIAEARHVQLGVALNQRYGFAVKEAKKYLDADNTRRQMITASMFQDFPKQPSGHFDEHYMMTDSCCHLLDLMTYLAGPALDGEAIGFRNEAGIYTNIGAVLQLENGCVGTMAHSVYGGSLDTQHPFQIIDIHTEKARYCVENVTGRLTVYPHDSRTRIVIEPSTFERSDYDRTITEACQDFLREVSAGRKAPITATEALSNVSLIEKMCISIKRISRTG